MKESALKKLAEDHFEKYPKTKEVFVLKNGLIFTVQGTAKRNSVRLNLGTPLHFQNPKLTKSEKEETAPPTTEQPVEATEETKDEETKDQTTDEPGETTEQPVEATEETKDEETKDEKVPAPKKPKNTPTTNKKANTNSKKK